MVFFRLNYLIIWIMHVDFLHNFDSFPTALSILSQPLSFGHKYNEK